MCAALLSGFCYIGLRIESLIVAANQAPPVENPSPEMISDENFSRLGYKNMHSIRWFDSPNAREFFLTYSCIYAIWAKRCKIGIYIFLFCTYG